MRDFIGALDLFKFSVLKNSKIILFILLWFIVVFPILISVVQSLPREIIQILEHIQNKLDSSTFLLIKPEILALLLWILLFILVRELCEKAIDVSKRTRSYNFTSSSWHKDWIYNGKTRLRSNSSILRVNSSRSGCLLAKYTWYNFKLNFKMRFLKQEDFVRQNDRHVGIIFRAKDLENYFMLEIMILNNCVCVKPHVRYQGMWDTMSEDKICGEFNHEPSWFSDWLDVNMIVKDNQAKLSINNSKEYEWHFPTHVDINHIESGIRETANTHSEQDVNFAAAKVAYLPEIDFRKNFGMIGFRAHLDQGADIKDLKISKYSNGDKKD